MTQVMMLIRDWREEAGRLRSRYNDESRAQLCEVHARELEQVLVASDAEKKTIKEASEISGYSYSHIRRLMDRGEIDNVGEPGAPKVLVGQLPFKSKRGSGAHARRAAERAAAEKARKDPGSGFKRL